MNVIDFLYVKANCKETCKEMPFVCLFVCLFFQKNDVSIFVEIQG